MILWWIPSEVFPGLFLFVFSWLISWLVLFDFDWLVGFKAPNILGVCCCCCFIHLGFWGIWDVFGFGVCGFLVGWFVFLVLFLVLYFACLFVGLFVFSRVLNMFLCF